MRHRKRNVNTSSPSVNNYIKQIQNNIGENNKYQYIVCVEYFRKFLKEYTQFSDMYSLLF